MADQTTTIPRGWRKLPIKDLVDFVVDNRGRNPDHYVSKGIPVIDNVLIKGERKVEIDAARRCSSREVDKFCQIITSLYFRINFKLFIFRNYSKP